MSFVILPGVNRTLLGDVLGVDCTMLFYVVCTLTFTRLALEMIFRNPVSFVFLPGVDCTLLGDLLGVDCTLIFIIDCVQAKEGCHGRGFLC